jgi:hypothetical protein
MDRPSFGAVVCALEEPTAICSDLLQRSDETRNAGPPAYDEDSLSCEKSINLQGFSSG